MSYFLSLGVFISLFIFLVSYPYAQSKVDLIAPVVPLLGEVVVDKALEKEKIEVENLKTEINNRTSVLKQSKKEIESLISEISVINSRRKSLENELDFVNKNNLKLLKEINHTKDNINLAELKITGYSKGINLNQKNAKVLKNTLGKLYQKLEEAEKFRLLYFLYEKNTLFDLLNQFDQSSRLIGEINKISVQLKNETENFYIDLTNTKQEENILKKLQQELTDRQVLYQESVDQQKFFLNVVKKGELVYQEELKKKLGERSSLEKELLEYESQLDFILDPNTIPDKNPGVLAYPLKSINVTQGFGRTRFALSNKGLYRSNFHAGVDFAASTGSQIFAAAGGRVIGTGDTDLIRGCRGLGKWTLIQHLNGLSTLYAHLSLIKVKPDQIVSQGDLIGYSGNTGYSTGAHLHFGVFFSKAVELVPYEKISSRCHGTYAVVAPQQAKLNPFHYLEK